MPTNTPRISVVIASIVGPPFIDDCIESVMKQKGAPPCEIIVVDCRGKENVARLRQKFPAVRFIELEERATVPRLRQLGAAAAQGEFVAIIEEHCLAAENWLAAIAASFQEGFVAVGGAIFDDNYSRLRDWVTYFVEYNNYMPPWPDAETTVLNGANLAYRREALAANMDLLTQGYWEATLHPKLLSEGKKFRSVPQMVVYHRGPFDYFYYLRQRYLFSRAFSGARRGAVSGKFRLLYLLASPVLPFVLLARIGQRVQEKGTRVGKFLLAVPLLLPALTIYVVGEVIGYWFGPGRALEEVE